MRSGLSKKVTQGREGGRSLNIASRSIGKKRKSGLKVYYTNCKSIINKMYFLRGLTIVEKLDIIALTETLLDMSRKIFGL